MINTLLSGAEKADLILALTELMKGEYPVEIQKAAKEKLLELLHEL